MRVSGGRGAGSLYRGALAQRFVEASKFAGGALDPVALRDYLPRWREPISVQVGDSVLLPDYGGQKVDLGDKDKELFLYSDQEILGVVESN